MEEPLLEPELPVEEPLLVPELELLDGPEPLDDPEAPPELDAELELLAPFPASDVAPLEPDPPLPAASSPSVGLTVVLPHASTKAKTGGAAR